MVFRSQWFIVGWRMRRMDAFFRFSVFIRKFLAVKTSVPHKMSRPNVSQPWVTADLQRLINRKDRAYRDMKKLGSDKTYMKQLRREVQRRLRHSYWKYLNNIFTGEDDPERAGKNKRFWTYIKNQKSTGTGVAPLKKDDQLTFDPIAQAEVLNAQFQSVFGDGAEFSEEEFEARTGVPVWASSTPPMDDIHITAHGVQKLMENLNPNKATGPDGISPRVLKELAKELAPGLTAVFQSSLTTGSVPADWKDAHVTPIFKKGEKYNPANYRPVSLTCVACKLMEHIVVSAMLQHFDNNDVLDINQHGFRRARSCETQLLDFTEELTSNLGGGKQTDVLIMDLAKAFDRVNHSLLTHKLRNFGVRGAVLAWIDNFLHQRRQAVVVNGSRSSFGSVRSGVPQGSVLGQTLFLAYINDLPERLTALARLFADDTAVYRVVTSVNDQAQLQQDLHRLTEWEKSWDMQFNPAKCNTLPVTRSRRPLQPSYQLHGHILETVKAVKYLGVTIQGDLCWDDHVNNIVSKANKTLGFLRRNLKISRSVKEQAYKAFVRPILEYASSVWDPHTQKNIDKLEAVQRRAARFVCNRYHNTSSVSRMLDSLGWQSLEERRKLARLSMLYKITNSIVHCPGIKSKLAPLPPRQRRGHCQQFGLITCRTQYRSAAFLPSTVKDWNSLPAAVVEARTVDTFVSRASH
ncbi:hypothetical protein ACOMHN_013843 [Nucella lapillus]